VDFPASLEENMDADTFLSCLNDAMPTRESLRDYGLDDEEIEGIRAVFSAPARNNAREGQSSELERLVAQFDCSRLEVGLVNFLGEIEFHLHGRIFAYCEADPLVVRENGVVAMYDHADPCSMQTECSSDSEKFLDALCEFIQIRTHKSSWKGRLQDASESCANAAGGVRYKQFYDILCSSMN
jgi:hypothetical protein